MAGNEKILVTGGTGFIGSHTVVELQNAGYEVVIIDNLSHSFQEVVERIGEITGKKPLFYPINLCDYQALSEFFKAHNDLDGVIHFAAYKFVGNSVENPLKYYRNNIDSMLNLLDLMVAYQVNSFVFSSSCTVYGEPESVPVSEDAPIQKAESPYGNTKHIGEDILEDTTNATKMEGISLRYFNPIGAHDSALIGEWPLGKPENLAPFLTQTAIGKREKLTVFGNDYPTPDGTCIRDYIHVMDVAKAHVIAMQRLLEKQNAGTCEVFNLGTGAGYSVLDVIKTFEKVTGVKVPYEIGERRPGDVVKVYADTTKANQELGWKAEKNLEDMMVSAWAWEKALNQEKAPSSSN